MNAPNLVPAIEAVRIANGGKAFVSVPLGQDLREALRELAEQCGVPSPYLFGIPHNDLVALYSVARTSPERAVQVAKRIADKIARHDPILDPPLRPEPSDPISGVEPRYSPLGAPAPNPRDALVAVLEAAERAARSTATEIAERAARECQGSLYLMRRDVENALTSIPALAAQAIRDAMPVTVQVQLPGKAPAMLGTVHKQTPRIIRALAAGLNVYIYGPAGSGKTTMARQLAKTFDTQFYFAAKVESEYLLLGFRDARGETIRTQFREAYEHGGVFLFDEIDASASGAIVALNAALANGICAFPDGIISRHADFKCIAAGNTKLTGANRQYTGRTQLDAASVDRFYFIEFGYDEELELSLASNRDWCLHVQAIRAAVAERGIEKLVTPRATLDGCTAIAAGDTWEEAEEACIWKGLDPDTVDQIKRAVRTGKGR